MTQRLYYDNATLVEFTARIQDRAAADRGHLVRLDRTAFYPTSGGQPHDTGTIAGCPVLDVWEDDQGEIWHLLAAAPIGDDVIGVIDWDRRFDHMQQHTGQHLLSAAFVDRLQANTVGFHIGQDYTTIDLDCPLLDWTVAAQIESAVNAVVWENRPIAVRTVTQAQISEIPFRKPPQVSSDIRVIWVEGYDASACGGTHVAQTGAVGMVKITGIERYKGGVRVTFLCGLRALKDHQRALGILRAASADLTVGQDEIPEAVARIKAESVEMRSALREVRSALFQAQAEHLWEITPAVDGVRRIVQVRRDMAFDDARLIANHLREQPGTLIFFATVEAKGIRLLCARSDDLAHVDAKTIVSQVCLQLGGRGGGSASVAQGGAPLPEAPDDEILAYMRKAADS